MSDNPSTPIQECKDVTKAERAAIDKGEPPYDGVRVYADLLIVRTQKKKED